MAPRHLENLNPAQKKAVLKTDGPLLVLAGAGTGKTRVVICRIAEILARGAKPSQICAVTFTNRAAAEMRERVQGLLAGTDLAGMVVSTFHSLGLRILREFARRAGLPAELTIADAADQVELMADVLREGGIRRDVLAPRAAHFRISLWKNAALSPDEARDAAEPGLEAALAAAYERYEALLQARRLVDFDDLILRTLRLLDSDAQVRERLQDRWRWLLVDEYQDTNGTQHRLLRHLAGERRNLCVVGDDDQSIYGWRGAEADRILRFTRDYPGAEVVTLEQNYRSVTAILDAANALIGRNTARRPKQLWSALGAGERIEAYAGEDEKDELDFVVSRIGLLRAQEQVRLQDFAVLFRANSQCRPLEQALRARQIPYRVVGTYSFFDRREVRDLLGYLRLARNPADDGAFLRIVNTPSRGFGRTSVEKVMGFAAEDRVPMVTALERHAGELSGPAREGGLGFLARLRAIQADSAAAGIAAALENLIEATGYRHHVRLLAEDPLELATRLSVVDDLLATAKTHEERGSGKSLESFLDALALRSEAEDEREEDERPAVTLLTMHAAKGLEFPVVFIIGVEEGILPHGKVVAGDEDEPEGSPAVEEERRLFYVGITRAKQRLHLTYAAQRSRHGREAARVPSRFIEEIGDEHLRRTTSADDPPTTADQGKAWLASIRKRFKEAGGPPAG